jgi:hypothetical protein
MTGIAALLAGLGLVALGFGLLTALLALLQPFADPIWIVGNLVVGVVLLGAAAFMSLDTLRERVQSGASRRAGRYGSSAILGAVFGIGILCLLAFLSVRHAHRFDLSEAGVHTLSAQTKDLIAGLEQDVQITAFFAASEAPPVRDLFDRYVYEGKRRGQGADRARLRRSERGAGPGRGARPHDRGPRAGHRAPLARVGRGADPLGVQRECRDECPHEAREEQGQEDLLPRRPQRTRDRARAERRARGPAGPAACSEEPVRDRARYPRSRRGRARQRDLSGREPAARESRGTCPRTRRRS